jgi:hypothetical protein
VTLPSDKFEAWSGDLGTIVASGKRTFGQLETTIGRLNHAAYSPVQTLSEPGTPPPSARHKEPGDNTRNRKSARELRSGKVSSASNPEGISDQMTIRKPSRSAGQDSALTGWVDSFCLEDPGGFVFRVEPHLWCRHVTVDMAESLSLVEKRSEEDCILALGDSSY